MMLYRASIVQEMGFREVDVLVSSVSASTLYTRKLIVRWISTAFESMEEKSIGLIY